MLEEILLGLGRVLKLSYAFAANRQGWLPPALLTNYRGRVMQISVIKTKTKTFYQVKRQDNYSSPSYGAYLFNGQKAIPTFDNSWFVVEGKLDKVEKIIPPLRINERFVLKNLDLASEKIPVTIAKEFLIYDEYREESDFNDPYSGLINLYESKFDYSEERLENVDLEIDTILEIEDIKEPSGKLKTSFVKQGIDKILFPSLVLHERPASISSLEFYKIIRNHIKSNINLEYASITSDYDFCFTVKKRIKLITPYQTQINTNIFGRKPKYKSVDVKFKEVEVFEMTHDKEKYRSYTILQGLEAVNDKELERKIDSILESLMLYINSPIDECSHCQGKGFIEIKKFIVPSI